MRPMPDAMGTLGFSHDAYQAAILEPPSGKHLFPGCLLSEGPQS
jgi:hypothetical protein